MLSPEWKDRVDHWIYKLSEEFYEPKGILNFEGYTTYEMLTEQEAETGPFMTMPEGTKWGRMWEYGWFRTDMVADESVSGEMLVMDIRTGGEATLFVNGQEFGTHRAEWVKEPHHYICDQILTRKAMPGEKFHILLEAYGGHDFPESPFGRCATGPVREGDYEAQDENAPRQCIGQSTWGIWHEEAYQLWLDVCMLRDLLEVTDETSLWAAKIEEALEHFTLIVDFEQPRADRLRSYVCARESVHPVLEAHNGTFAPEFYAVGNAHLDICWLWPYRETQRKVARTFAQQVRLMDLYPEYKFIQSQPQSYLICKQFYPKLYAKIKEKVKTGQWIADGSMWVEPDTNMASGEALIRQIVHGKRFYKEEFDVDCQLLWLPDTFGYSAVLPQILKGCGVKYLTTQKIFWTYNGSEPFPYHYFTWQGMDGSEIVSFLHMDYTSRTDAATVVKRWKDRVQKRDITKFLLPFGYGDGGGGPTRDHIENVLREKDLEGVPKVQMESPQKFFEDCAQDGAPKNRYVGELYFQCHRGTYTTQAAIKRGNRKSELALREAEIWSIAAQDKLPYPTKELDRCWKNVLLNQFHDILPGSSIARVYEEANKLYSEVLNHAEQIVRCAQEMLTQGDGWSYFNSLSWTRKALVQTEEGYGFAVIPPMGATSSVDKTEPEQPVYMRMEDEELIMGNGLIEIRLNNRGEMVDCRDEQGCRKIGEQANVLCMYKDVPRKFDAWDIDSMYPLSPVELNEESTIEPIENTPWHCSARVTRRIGHSDWVQIISMTAGKRQIDFDTEVSWHETHRLLKVAFQTGIQTDEAINEIQFGYVRRPTHQSRRYDADRFEVCNHRYTALCDEGRGAAVLNESKYGVSQMGDTIALTLLRAAKSPDFHADQGKHHFAYSYYIWNGSFVDSDVMRAGYELNVPVTRTKGYADFSLLSIDKPNVVIETVKAAEDGSGDTIVRLYESKHASCTAELTLNMPVRHVYACNMLERELDEIACEEGKVKLNLHGFEIKTLRLKK